MLDEFVDIKENRREEVLLIDLHNMCMRCLFAIPFNPTDVTFVEYKTTVLRSIKVAVKRFNPDRVIFAMEGFHNWRKDLYTDYKVSRKAGREASVIDFDEFFKQNNAFLDGLKNCFKNAQFIQIPKLEADDIIALVTKYNPQWNITLISSDKDFYQLHKYKHFKQFDGIKDKFVEVIDPQAALLLKIITGDGSDDIPHLMKGIGPKKAAKILEDGLDEWLDKNDLREAFDRNTTLISFDCIPLEYHQPVKDIVNNWVRGTFNGREYYNFLVDQGLGALFELSNEFTTIFNRIGSAFASKETDTPTQPEFT